MEIPPVPGPELAGYRPPAWLRGSHVESIYPYFFLRGRPVAYRRERLDTPDGDFIDFDWFDNPSCSAKAPVLIAFHGLEGSSRSHYIGSVMRELGRRGWRGAVPHWRGCGGQPNRLPRAYHSGDYAEVEWMLGAVRDRVAGAPVFALGVSLGGSALLNWLGREGAKSRTWLRAAASVCAPADLVAAGLALDRGLNRLYARHFLGTLIPKCLAMQRRFPGIFDPQALRRVRTMQAFDDLVTAPLHGFRNALDYWTRASSKAHLPGVRVPTLVLNALNDPFIPAASLPQGHEVSASVVLEKPAHGGHVGFASGLSASAGQWLPQRLLQFFEENG